MSESDTASVECPLCGEAFDPTAAGGWCTNSECGEWQYETDVTPDQQTAAEENRTNDEPATSADGSDPLDGAKDEDSETADESSSDAESGAESADTASDSPEADDSAGSADSATDAEIAAAKIDEPAAGSATSAAEPEPDDGVADDETFDCPGCGSSLAADVNFCPDCGEDVGALPDDDGANELDACPSCGADVDSDDNFCVECGEDLDAHRGESDVLSVCPDCGADVDDDDSFCADCGADLDAHRSGEAGATGDQAGGATASHAQSGSASASSAPAPDALALTAHGKSVVVGDGDIVGREIRSLLTEAGHPEDEAVRVHREHVRFVRESDQFYAVALGQNPTRLNDVSLAKGDQFPVAPGDELELSDVVTLDVEAA